MAKKRVNNTKFKCYLCSKILQSEKNLIRHINEIHYKKLRPHFLKQCNFCKKKLFDNSIVKHIRNCKYSTNNFINYINNRYLVEKSNLKTNKNINCLLDKEKLIKYIESLKFLCQKNYFLKHLKEFNKIVLKIINENLIKNDILLNINEKEYTEIKNLKLENTKFKKDNICILCYETFKNKIELFLHLFKINRNKNFCFCMPIEITKMKNLYKQIEFINDLIISICKENIDIKKKLLKIIRNNGIRDNVTIDDYNVFIKIYEQIFKNIFNQLKK